MQALELFGAVNVFIISGVTLGCRHYPLQPVCRELNSNLFALKRKHFSMSRTNSSHVSNSGSVCNLAQFIVSYVSETKKNIGHMKKLI